MAFMECYQIYPKYPGRSKFDPSILSNLSLNMAPKPLPGRFTALVRLRAAALNHRDNLVLAFSTSHLGARPNLTPCSDGAGEIVAVGVGSVWHVGQRVIIAPSHSWHSGTDMSDFDFTKGMGSCEMPGTLQQYRAVEDKWLCRMPDNLTFAEAATVPTAGGSAYNGVFYQGFWGGKVEDLRGKTVLTQGSGGVSCFAIQLAKAAGARVISTSSSTEKLEALKRIGATDLINYRELPDWGREALKMTGGKGVDLVVDVAGSGTIEQSVLATRQGGTVVVVGRMTRTKQMDLIPAILNQAKTVRGCLAFSKVMLDELMEFIEKHDIHPVVGERFSWEDAPRAFEAMMKQRTVGKIVVDI